MRAAHCRARPAPRGMTLLETLIASAIMAVALAAATSLVLAGGSMARNTRELSDSNDASRLAVEAIIGAARRAGLGAARGLWVGSSGGAVRISPLFGLDGTTGAGQGAGGPVPHSRGWDDLWLVVPSRDALREPCSVPGAAAPLADASIPGSPLSMSCTGGFGVGDLLMVSNLASGALIRIEGLIPGTGTMPGILRYAEQSVAGFSNAPEKNGFQRGDLALPVELVHFYVALDASGVPALYRSAGEVVPDPAGRPFSDIPGTRRLVQRNIEDLQVAYGLDTSLVPGDPDRYVFQHGLAPIHPGALRSLRISVVARTAAPLRDSRRGLIHGLVPRAVENHVPAAVPDGFRRSVYTRRVEIPNMLAGSI